MSLKHVLVITYYWPPAGGPGVQRWLKFCKYLPDNGITPIVYCPKNPTYPITDDSLQNEIPESIEVLKMNISEPYKFAGRISKKKTKSISSGIVPRSKDQSITERLMLFARGNLFIPDARKNWIKPSVNYLKDIIKQRAIKCIITTGPPHSLHLIGMYLKKGLGIHWVADFRDPWTTIGYHKALKLLPSSKKKHLLLEHQVLNETDEVVVTSKNTKNEFKLKTTKPITVITNGYDSHDVTVASLDKKFSISHIGSLLSDRNPKVLWKVLSELIEEIEGFRESLQLNFVGVVSKDIVNDLNDFGLDEFLNLVGYVSHEEAIKFQLKSQLLLLIEIDSEETKAIIPGKLFEYLQSNRPIIGIGPKDSDVESILTDTNAGRYFYYSDRNKLKEYLYESFIQFKEGILINQPIGLKKYSRKELTKSLASLLNKYI